MLLLYPSCISLLRIDDIDILLHLFRIFTASCVCLWPFPISHIINVGGHIDLTCAAGGLVGGGMNEFVAMHNIRILKFIRVLCI